MTKMTIFILIIVINFIGTLAYVLWGYYFHPERKRMKQGNPHATTYEPKSYLFRGGVLILCPVVGLLSFFIAFVLNKWLIKSDADLAGVTFSKERVETIFKGNEDRDRNLVPLEEAIAITDKKDVRQLMLNIIKGDFRKSLSSIARALNSEDSETAHYAASVLLDELNEFRENVSRITAQIFEGDQVVELSRELIPYMNQILYQNVFTEIEQKNFVMTMEKVMETLYTTDSHQVDAVFYEMLCARLLESKEYELMEKWCDRLAAAYPKALSAFTTRLKLYFTTNNKERFFEVMKQLQHSEVIIDKETLDLIRIFT